MSYNDDSHSISIVIPTFNPDERFSLLIDRLRNQSIEPDEIFIIDSESDNHFFDELDLTGIHFETVSRKDFDHGRTRDYCVRKCIGEIIILMTQDALPCDSGLLTNLVSPLYENENVAAVMARQVAYPEASIYEKYVREFSYPDVSRLTTPDNMGQFGIDAFKLSDVCTAYRKSAYLEVGGFDFPILTNEDMLISQKFLDSGYAIAYSSDAKVYHSHNLSFKQQYLRNHKIGYTLECYRNRFGNIEESGRGAKLAVTVSWRLIKGLHFISLVHFAIDCIARYAGNRNGHKSFRQEEQR